MTTPDFNGDWCTHPHTRLVRRVNGGGQHIAVEQCVECGEQRGGAIKRPATYAELPPFDEALRQRYQDERKARFEAAREARLARRDEWWERYTEYLRSPEWAERRSAVMTRAGGICEACGRTRATEVHHTTYAHAFAEPLWELRAVCNPCHETITQMDRTAKGAA